MMRKRRPLRSITRSSARGSAGMLLLLSGLIVGTRATAAATTVGIGTQDMEPVSGSNIHSANEQGESQKRMLKDWEQRQARIRQINIKRKEDQWREQTSRLELEEITPDLTDPQFNRQLQEPDVSSCTLCYDGSAILNPFAESARMEGFTCGYLSVLVESTAGLSALECLEFQTVGATDCECPTSPLDKDYCALCPTADGSAQLIPDSNMNLPIPQTNTQPVAGLTCADLVFQEQPEAQIPCDDGLETYRRYCGCPRSTHNPTPVPTLAPFPSPTGAPVPNPTETSLHNTTVEPLSSPSPTSTATLHQIENTEFTCNFCPDQNLPQFTNRTLPYLTTAPTPQSNALPFNPQNPNEINTCGVLAETARTSATNADECYAYVFPQVALDVQSYCGCTGTTAAFDLCSLCPAGSSLVNPDLSVPGAGGMSCLELEDYMRFVTDEDSCIGIAESARTVCCTSAPECPVCVNPVFTNYNRDKLYPPYGLTCSQLNLALSPTLGFSDVTCQGIQERFGYYCECPNAIRPSCSLCPMDEDPPEPSLEVPALGPGVTCGEINDYASLRPEASCVEEVAGWSVDAQAYCGCAGFEARGMCSVQCPAGLVVNRNVLVPDEMGMSVNGFISCGELVDFAPFVNSASLCSAMQDSIRGCCVPEGTTTGSDEADEATVSEQRTFRDGNGGFVAYPFLNNEEDVYLREFISSPYAGTGTYSTSSATVGSTAHLLISLVALIFIAC